MNFHLQENIVVDVESGQSAAFPTKELAEAACQRLVNNPACRDSFSWVPASFRQLDLVAGSKGQH